MTATQLVGWAPPAIRRRAVIVVVWWAMPTLSLALLAPTGVASASDTTVSGITLPPKLSRVRIADGGGDVAGGTYRLMCTIGQPEASGLAGGTYVLSGGFWTPARPPGDIVWNTDPLSPDRTTRSLRFRVDAATASGVEGENAIKVELVEWHCRAAMGFCGHRITVRAGFAG